MNYLLIAVLVLIAWNTLSGYRKGFLKTIFSLISWIVILVICYIATPKVADFFVESTMVGDAVARVVSMGLNEMFPENDIAILEQSVPEDIRVVLFGEEGSLRDMLMAGGETLINTTGIVYKIVSVFAFVVVFGVSLVLVTMVNLILGVASKLPVIGSVDRVLGLACGVVKGLLVCWVLLAAVGALSLTGANTEWATYITQSQFLMWLQNNNFILNRIVLGV